MVGHFSCTCRRHRSFKLRQHALQAAGCRQHHHSFLAVAFHVQHVHKRYHNALLARHAVGQRRQIPCPALYSSSSIPALVATAAASLISENSPQAPATTSSRVITSMGWLRKNRRRRFALYHPPASGFMMEVATPLVGSSDERLQGFTLITLTETLPSQMPGLQASVSVTGLWPVMAICLILPAARASCKKPRSLSAISSSGVG